MLKKVLKYDLQNIFKFIIIFYSLSLFFAVLTRIFLSIEQSFIMNIIGKVCSGVTISMIINILINNLMRLWVRFKNNFYGDESYLTHTLPVNKTTLYLSKVLSSIITLFTSIIVIAITLFIAYYSKENMQMLKNVLLPLADIYNSTIIQIILVFLFIFFVEFATALQSGYTGIILGHKMNNAKTGFSVLFGFVSYLVVQIIVLLFIFIVALFNPDIMNLFFSNEITSIEILKTIMYLAILIYVFIFIVNYIINLIIFKKGVNVD